MPARTGQQYLERLRQFPPSLWIHGQHIVDPTAHPLTQNTARSIAGLYDLQHQPGLRDEMTYMSGNQRVGLSFLETHSREDLERRAKMHTHWAAFCLGFMGRTPDYLNVNLMAAARAADYFSENSRSLADVPNGVDFGENIRNYYTYVRENDLALTHALTNPQVNRSVSALELSDPYIALGVVEKNKEGIVVRGARMMATLPLADEILIFPSTVLKEQEDLAPYALAFAIPTCTPGLHFQCRESMDASGLGAWDHPLSSRFEEYDAFVIFDNVFVPWERVFLLGDVSRCNRAYSETGSVLHMAHQVICNKIVKTEALLGVAASIVETIGSGSFQHVQNKIAQIIINLEVMKSLKLASEHHSAPDRWGTWTPARAPLDAARNLFPQLYPQMAEVVQVLASSGLVMIPTEGDFEGPMAGYLDKYLQGTHRSARDRVQLMRLAWDMTLSSFGARQNHYERFFFGDPVRTLSALYMVYDKGPAQRRIEDFLAQTQMDPVIGG